MDDNSSFENLVDGANLRKNQRRKASLTQRKNQTKKLLSGGFHPSQAQQTPINLLAPRQPTPAPPQPLFNNRQHNPPVPPNQSQPFYQRPNQPGFPRPPAPSNRFPPEAVPPSNRFPSPPAPQYQPRQDPKSLYGGTALSNATQPPTRTNSLFHPPFATAAKKPKPWYDDSPGSTSSSSSARSRHHSRRRRERSKRRQGRSRQESSRSSFSSLSSQHSHSSDRYIRRILKEVLSQYPKELREGIRDDFYTRLHKGRDRYSTKGLMEDGDQKNYEDFLTKAKNQTRAKIINYINSLAHGIKLGVQVAGKDRSWLKADHLPEMVKKGLEAGEFDDDLDQLQQEFKDSFLDNPTISGSLWFLNKMYNAHDRQMQEEEDKMDDEERERRARQQRQADMMKRFRGSHAASNSQVQPKNTARPFAVPPPAAAAHPNASPKKKNLEK